MKLKWICSVCLLCCLVFSFAGSPLASQILNIHSADLLVKDFSRASNLYLTALSKKTPESFQSALDAFVEITRSNPLHGAAFIHEGDCLNLAGEDPTQAYESAYQLLLEKKQTRDRLLPELKDPELFSDMVYCLNGMKRYKEARKAGLRGLRIGKDPDLYLNLAYTFTKLGQDAVAREFLCKASGMRPLVGFRDLLSYRRIAEVLEKGSVFDGMACQETRTVAKGTYYAILISVGEYHYTNQGLTSLPYTGNDVRDLFKILTDPAIGSFAPENVILLKDRKASLSHVKKSFDELATRVKKEDTVLIFFAGHGYTSPLTKEAYWLTYDTEIGDDNGNRIDSTAFPSTELAKKVMALESDDIVFFVDACQSGGVSEQKAPRGLDNYLDPSKNYAIIASCQSNQLSMGVPEYKHGLFSYHLIRGLRGEAETNGDGRIEFEELWPYVRDRVSEDARKFGREQNPKIFNSSSGSIFLTVNPEY